MGVFNLLYLGVLEWSLVLSIQELYEGCKDEREGENDEQDPKELNLRKSYML